MDRPEPAEPSAAEAEPSKLPLWWRLARIAVVLAIVILAVLAFGSWYFTSTFDYVFGPPR